ncbi:unnamed protein product [Albugo candida]|uniref:Catalase core domain-containing protein n=1 Tax=Albugo candida TaxID=65357 RepID=A0A024G451_9STRA|nr:unnamed protein product [Albugo candida]|eukprot:CCI41416.1 unnamed protein product [Albugo candida]
MFSKVGKRTPIAVRFSQVALESGSPDTVRDVRGFAVKFYSEKGNWDLVGNNTPVFFIRDPILFPSFIHALKRNPQTHLRDNNLFWDFLSLRPESLHQQTILFSDRGIPDGYRFMNGYGSNTFKNVNENGEVVFVKYHYKSDQGIRNLSDELAQKLSGLDADYALRDLFESIASENYPVWTMYLQVMTPEQAQHCSFNPFDVTKIWPHNEFPLIEIGRFVLNRNPQNYFAEVEQLVFSPAHFIPGIGPSPDKVLQGRLFSYNDAHYHRLGVNYSQIPVNRTVINSQTYHRDGLMRVDGNMFNEPAHFPNSLGGPEESKVEKFQSYSGDFSVIDKYETRDDDNFTQTRLFYQKVLDDSGRERLAGNIAGSLVNASKEVQTRVLANFEKVDPDYAKRVDKQLQVLEQENAKGMIKEKQPTAPMNPPRAPFKVTMEMSDDVLAPQFRRQCAV